MDNDLYVIFALRPTIKIGYLTKTIKADWDSILEWERSQINNGILEGLITQATETKARDFRIFKNFGRIVFLTTGELRFKFVNQYVGLTSAKYRCPLKIRRNHDYW